MSPSRLLPSMLILIVIAAAAAGGQEATVMPVPAPAGHAPSSRPGPAFVCPQDFDVFWARALAQLAPLRPGLLDATSSGEVSFPVTEVVSASGYWCPPREADAMPVVHVVESTSPRPAHPPTDGRAHLYITWRPADRSLADWYLRGLDQPGDGGLMTSVLTACQAVDLVRTRTGLDALRAGIVGDGYGAVMALAAAALLPDRVSFVIAHQPRPAFHRLRDGTLSSCPEIARVLQSIPRSRQAVVFTRLAYYDAVNFAARVRRPTLVIAGGRDEQAPPAEVRMLYDRLTCERGSQIAPNMRHRPSDSVAEFPAILAQVTAQVTSP